MSDILLDTNLLNDLLAQYFNHFQNEPKFYTSTVLNKEVIHKINSIIDFYHNDMYINLVIASTFAFVEISRKFDEIVKNQFSISQFSSFINQPPEWFYIAPMDSSLFISLSQIPSQVTMSKRKAKRIEWTDAIHLATAMTREDCLFATTDSRLKKIKIFKNGII